MEFSTRALQPKSVDVIIPALNVGPYIEHALTSLIPDIDSIRAVYVIDNGSEDDTIARTKSWAASHPEVALHLSIETTTSACAARNHGIRLSKSTWLRFVDADDTIVPGSTRMLLDAGEREHADVVYAHHFCTDANGRKTCSLASSDTEIAIASMRNGYTVSNLFRRDAFIVNGMWDEAWTSAQEKELMSRWAENGARFAFLDASTATWNTRPGPGQISKGNEAKRRLNLLHLSQRSFRWHLAHSKNRSAQIEAGAHLFNAARSAIPFHTYLAQETLTLLSTTKLPWYRSDRVKKHFAWTYRVGGFRALKAIQLMSVNVRSAQPVGKWVNKGILWIKLIVFSLLQPIMEYTSKKKRVMLETYWMQRCRMSGATGDSLVLGGWAMGAPMYFLLHQLKSRSQQLKILEFGTGQSTQLFSGIKEKQDGLIENYVGIEENSEFANRLQESGLPIILAKTKRISGTVLYDFDESQIGFKPNVILVDGPRGAWPVSRGNILRMLDPFLLDPDFVIIIDDTNRAGEFALELLIFNRLKEQGRRPIRKRYFGEKSTTVIAPKQSRFAYLCELSVFAK